MSNDFLNVRFGTWHLHIMRDAPFVLIARNPYHDTARLEPGWKWFEVY